MFWLKLLVVFPLLALILYMTTGKTVASMIVCLIMLAAIKLSLFLLSEITNQN